MSDVALTLAGLGGVASVRQLSAVGVSSGRPARAAQKGDIVRIRRGWYSTTDARPDVQRAVRAGGVLSCGSAGAAHGIWQPPDARLHVAVPHSTGALRHPDTGRLLPDLRSTSGVVLHWSASTRSRGGVAPLLETLALAARCQPEEYAFAMIESALRRGLTSPSALASCGGRVARLAVQARADADSGTESVFRFRMARLGIPMRSQVPIPGVGRVDFVIGDRLVVELDSGEHHGGDGGRLRDLSRDLALAGLNGRSLRVDYRQVFDDWVTVESVILAMIDRRDHLHR